MKGFINRCSSCKSLAKSRNLKSFFWSGMGSGSKAIIQLVFGVLIARQLAPGDFGLVAMLSIFLGLAQALTESGLGVAIIQKKELTEEDQNTAFCANLCLGIFCYLLLYFFSASIAIFYHRPELDLITKVMGLHVLILSVTAVQRAIISREMRFDVIAKSEVFASVCAGVFTYILALCGFGVWSLVFQSLILSFVQTIIIWRCARWVPKLKFYKSSFKELWRFSSYMLFNGIADQFFRNALPLVLGKLFDAATLGFCNQAQRLQNTVTNLLNSVFSRVLFPIFAKKQGDLNGLRSLYGLSVSVIAILSIAPLAALAVNADWVIETLLGSKWTGAIPYLVILSLGAMPIAINSVGIELLKGIGQANCYFKIQMVKRLVLVAGLLLGSKWGAAGLVVGFSFTFYFGYIYNLFVFKHFLGFKVTDQLMMVFFPGLVAIAWFICDRLWISPLFSGGSMSDVLSILAGVAGFALCVLVKFRTISKLISIREPVVL